MEMGRRRSLGERMKDAALLRTGVYEEVESDSTATGQAALVVGIVAIAMAIGGVQEGAAGFIGGLVAVYVGWLLWSGVTYLIGDKLLGGTATWGELLRTLGFAQSPGVLYVLGIIPFLGGIITFIVAIWILVAGIVAIRQALDVSTGRAIVTAVLGWLVYFVFRLLLVWLTGAQLG